MRREPYPRPIEALAWLIDEFRRYTRNQSTWLDVRRVLAEAEELRDHYQHHMDRLLAKYDPATHHRGLIFDHPPEVERELEPEDD